MTRTALRHLSLLFLALGLMGLGSVLVARGDGYAFQTVGAESLGYIQIAPYPSSEWDTQLGPVWTLENGAPGDTSSERIRIRTVDLPNRGATTFHVSAEMGGSVVGTQLADHIIVEEMRLGAANLLGFWDDACLTDGNLTLTALVECDAPALPLPGTDDGTVFELTFVIDPAAGNAVQGLRTGMVSLLFTLVDPTPDAPEEPGDTGSVSIIHVTDDRIDPAAFNLSITGDNGASGPGPELVADGFPVGVETIASVIGPDEFEFDDTAFDLVLDGVTCLSSTRGDLGVADAWAVPVALDEEGEDIQCIFESSLEATGVLPEGPPEDTPTPEPTATPVDDVAGETAVPTETGTETPGVGASPTPQPPATGTGNTTASSMGVGMMAIGAVLLILWASSATLALATIKRRKRSQ